MQRKLIAVLVGIVLACSMAPGAFGKSDNNDGKSGFKRAFKFHGTIASTDGDGDATPGPFVVTVTKANGNAKRHLAGTPGDPSIALLPTTRYYGAADDASDFAVGDAVKVKVRSTETGFVAKKIKLKAPEPEDPAPVV